MEKSFFSVNGWRAGFSQARSLEKLQRSSNSWHLHLASISVPILQFEKNSESSSLSLCICFVEHDVTIVVHEMVLCKTLDKMFPQMSWKGL